MQFTRSWLAFVLAFATFLGAFLVFQVQPVISKAVLPWFGGCPAVWTTSMLFFQVLLFGGYAYAHVLTSCCLPRRQGLIHLGLLAVALLSLPILPSETWKPDGDQDPTARLLLILSVSVGLPYFLLSATGPLLQHWFGLAFPGRRPYRLYALSNVGSLAALLTYPVLVEPRWGVVFQSAGWSLAFCLFVVTCGVIVWGQAKLYGCGNDDLGVPATSLNNGQATAAPVSMAPTSQQPGWRKQALWFVLPALASVMLLATTNHVCQDVAVVPFLWVAPLALYLMSFIICFDREHWYVRRWFTGLTLVAVVGLHLALSWRGGVPLVVEAGLCLTNLFLLCMVCHGELVRSKPEQRFLTRFYLCSSAGGAVGGVVVAVLCPLLFTTHREMDLGLLGSLLLASGMWMWELRHGWLARPQRRLVAGLACLAALLFVMRVQREQRGAEPVAAARNFYGTLCVARSSQVPGTSLVHGRIIHGFQFDQPELRHEPTTYYGRQSGVGLALTLLRGDQPLRVGAVGLGCGTVAAFGRAGDYYRFYEINPAVVDVAEQNFGFLSESPARIETQLGDARLSLEREQPQHFDVLILDAFSGDSVPAHLLTKEAFATYRRHLKPDGIIAVHISNRHLRLEPVVIRQAEHLRMQCIRLVTAGDFDRAVLVSKWMLITNNEPFLRQPQITQIGQMFGRNPGREFPLWTDQYNNLFQILKVF